MTILDEAKQIRNEIARLRPDKRRRYPPGLKARIMDWHARATASGMFEADAAKLLGMKTWRITEWRRAPTQDATRASASLALVRVETPEPPPAMGLALVTPSGHRVEGLVLAQVVALLRELA